MQRPLARVIATAAMATTAKAQEMTSTTIIVLNTNTIHWLTHMLALLIGIAIGWFMTQSTMKTTARGSEQTTTNPTASHTATEETSAPTPSNTTDTDTVGNDETTPLTTATTEVYYVPKGTRIHKTRDCVTLRRSTQFESMATCRVCYR